MRLLHRRDTPPASAVAHLGPGERVVSWADTTGGAVVVATPLGLWWPAVEGELRLIGWHRIDKATWQARRLTVIEADVVDDLLLVDLAPIAVELTVPRDLPPTVRKRVEASVARSEVLPVTGGSARFVARRVPGVDGQTWWARLEPGTPDVPEVRSAVGAQVARLRAEVEAQAAAQLW